MIINVWQCVNYILLITGNKLKKRPIQIYMVHLDVEINLSYNTHLFDDKTNRDILSYRNYSDRLKAFTSALLKYYFLPSIVGVSSNALKITRDSFGRPYLSNYLNVDFNISHSGKYVVLAVAFGRKIGIDIEQINKEVDLEIAKVVFNPYELRQISNFIDFYLLWVKKEAYLKCIGKGFATDAYLDTGLDTTITQSVHDHEIHANYINQDYIFAICCRECKDILESV